MLERLLPSKAHSIAARLSPPTGHHAAISLALFYVAVVLFYATLWPAAPLLASDSPGYLEVAKDLSPDLSLDDLHMRTPGYPVLLLLTGSSQQPTRLLFFAQLLLHFSAAWLLSSALLRITGSASLALMFGLVMALPPYVEPAAYVLTESLTEFTLAVAFTSLVYWVLRPIRSFHLVLIGGSLAFAALTRPVYQLLPLTICGVLILIGIVGRNKALKATRFRAAIVIPVISLIPVVALAFFNLLRFSYFGITPNLGLNLATRTASFVEKLPSDYGQVRDTLVRVRNEHLITGSSHTAYQYLGSALKDLEQITGLKSYPDLANYLLRLNVTLIVSHPLNYLNTVGRDMASYWLPYGGQLSSMGVNGIQLVWSGLHFVVLAVFISVLVLVAGVVAFGLAREYVGKTDEVREAGEAVRAQGTRLVSFALAAAIVFYTMALTVLIDTGDPRHRVPTDALVIVMCVIGVQSWWEIVRTEAGKGGKGAVAGRREPALATMHA